MGIRWRSFGYVTGEFASAVFARLAKPQDDLAYAAIHSPGRGSTDLSLLTAPWDVTTWAVTNAEERRSGITYQSGVTYGNDAIQTQIEALRAHLGTTYGARVDKVHFVAGSMGALNALNYTRANPDKVKSLVLQVPLTDLIELHDGNVGGLAAEVEAAYASEPGGWAGQKVEHSPQEHLAEFASLDIPMKVWASSDDPFIPLATAQEFATGVGAEFVNMGAVDHNPTLYEPLNDEIVEFLAAND